MIRWVFSFNGEPLCPYTGVPLYLEGRGSITGSTCRRHSILSWTWPKTDLNPGQVFRYCSYKCFHICCLAVKWCNKTFFTKSRLNIPAVQTNVCFTLRLSTHLLSFFLNSPPNHINNPTVFAEQAHLSFQILYFSLWKALQNTDLIYCSVCSYYWLPCSFSGEEF